MNMFKSKKQNNRTSGVARAKKVRKQTEALERQAKYDSLTLDQKLAKSVPGSRQHTKLMQKKVG